MEEKEPHDAQGSRTEASPYGALSSEPTQAHGQARGWAGRAQTALTPLA